MTSNQKQGRNEIARIFDTSAFKVYARQLYGEINF